MKREIVAAMAGGAFGMLMPVWIVAIVLAGGVLYFIKTMDPQ